MPRFYRGKNLDNLNQPGPEPVGNGLRIVGGTFRGRTIRWSGDQRTRPMKDSVREALFNLVGGWVPGRHAIDLFAGTGAIGLEALSRGAVAATLVERHFPTARIIRENIETLDPTLPAEICKSDSFFWVRQFVKPGAKRPTVPWLVFCSPPWNLFERRADELVEMVRSLIEVAPAKSIFVVESDDSFDPSTLPEADAWRIRHYPPALLCILRPDLADSAIDPEADSSGSPNKPGNSVGQADDQGGD